MCKMKVIVGILLVIAFVGLPASVQAQSDDGLVVEWWNGISMRGLEMLWGIVP